MSCTVTGNDAETVNLGKVNTHFVAHTASLSGSEGAGFLAGIYCKDN